MMFKSNGNLEFKNALSVITLQSLQDRSEEEKKRYYEFLIDVVKKDLIYSPIVEMLGQIEGIDISLNPFPDMHYKKLEESGLILDEKIEVDMTTTPTVSYPDSHGKLSLAVSDIEKAGFIESSDYTGVYIKELNIAFITNGFHHTSAASAIGTGKFSANVFDFQTLMAKYKSDGEYWIRMSDEKKVYLVKDFRISVLCEFYRILHEKH